jgi:hypothetical protein
MLSLMIERLKKQSENQDAEMKSYYQGVMAEEIQFIDSIKIILDAGWCIDL